MVEVNFKLYKISRCGYYSQRGQKPLFSSLEKTFDNLVRWAKSVSIQQSSTFDPEPDESILKCYVVDCIKSTGGDYFFAIWNGVPTTDTNAVSAISGDRTVGQTLMQFKDFDKGFIPGFATYFWINTKNEYLATVRFKRAYNGHQSFKAYMRGFLSTFSEYCVVETDPQTGNSKIVGYSEDKDKVSKAAFPRFYTESIRNTGPIDFIRSNIHKARSIIKKDLIVKDSARVSTVYDFLYKLIGSQKDRLKIDKDINIRYELPFDMSLAELNQVYSTWKVNADSEEDVGIRIGTETYWFSHEVQKTDLFLEVKTVNSELYNLESLASQIELNKERIINECLKGIS